MDVRTAIDQAAKAGKSIQIAREEWKDSEGNLEQYFRFVPDQVRKPLFGKQKVLLAHWVRVQIYVEVEYETVGVGVSTHDYEANDWFVVP